MDTLEFDLISDLYLENMDNISWVNKPTSLFCIIAGNVSKHRQVLIEFLNEVRQYYRMVFFIDGELEHTEYWGDFDTSFEDLKKDFGKMENVVYLHENIVMLNHIGIIGINGWTTFDFTATRPMSDTLQYLNDNELITETDATNIFRMAMDDQDFLYRAIINCQKMPECKRIFIISNTVPDKEFIEHHADYDGTILGDIIGNSAIIQCLENDTEGKTQIWAFGRFHDNLDFVKNNIRFTSNPRDACDLEIYYPKKLIM